MKKKILVCGAGSIGKRHIKNLLNHDIDIYVWRNRTALNAELLENFNNEIIIANSEINKSIESVDAVVVANSTINHRSIIEKSIYLKKHLYIEKPIDVNHKGLVKLMEDAKSKGLVVEVGCQLRKHPSLVELKKLLEKDLDPILTFRIYAGQRLEYWRPGTDYRKSYSADKNKGGGALLDLIHEIDLCLWLMGDIKEVFGILSNVSDQEIKADDLVNVLVSLESGGIGNIQLDLFSPSLRRGVEIITKNRIFLWDYNRGNLEVIKKETKETIFAIPESFRRNDMFVDLMNHFLARIKDTDIKPSCSFESGIRSLEVVSAIEKSHKNSKPVTIKGK